MYTLYKLLDVLYNRKGRLTKPRSFLSNRAIFRYFMFDLFIKIVDFSPVMLFSERTTVQLGLWIKS